MLSGHVHFVEMFKRKNVMFLACGPSGGGLNANIEFHGFIKGIYGGNNHLDSFGGHYSKCYLDISE